MSKQIQWGILGTANIAAKVGQAIQKADNANLVAIASRSVTKAKHWAETHRLPKYYDSYQQLLSDTEIEAVYIPAACRRKRGTATRYMENSLDLR